MNIALAQRAGSTDPARPHGVNGVAEQGGKVIEPLVLLPGFMCDVRLFEQQIKPLSRDRAVTVAPVAAAERIEDIATALLEQLPGRFALVGHGLGGVVALEVINQAPDRVTRLCLISTDAQADTPIIAADREELIIGAQAGRLDEVMRKVMGSDALAPGPRRIPIMNDVLQMADDLGPQVFATQMRALQRRVDQQAALSCIRVPTLIICGAHDTLVPERKHRFMAEMIPGATLRVIDNAGHLPTLEAPEQVTGLLSTWLQEPLFPR